MLPADPRTLGATVTEGGTNFAIWSNAADAIELCLFNEVNGKLEPIVSIPVEEIDGSWCANQQPIQTKLHTNGSLQLLFPENNKVIISTEKINSQQAEKSKLISVSKEKKTIQEGRMFSRNANGSYSAQSGNDDIIMTSVTASAFFDTLDYYEIIEEYFDHMEDSKQKKIDGILDSSGDDSDNLYDMMF